MAVTIGAGTTVGVVMACDEGPREFEAGAPLDTRLFIGD
jgi:hypothetical protein